MFCRRPRDRRGTIVVLSAILMVAMMGVLAFSIDLGVVLVARDELQRSADASAIAAAWELIDDDAVKNTYSDDTAQASARSQASTYAGLNTVLQQAPALATSDVEIGYLANVTTPSTSISTSSSTPANAVKVTIRRTTGTTNGAVNTHFARIFGRDTIGVQAEAIAAFATNLSGFSAPSDGSNLDLLPFALDEDTWNNMLNNVGSDTYRWNSAQNQVQSGSDGVLEINLYPQGTGSPGNRGTVDIGSSNNSTADIARQIVHGVSPSDLSYHNGELKLDSQGELLLNGDTGISAGVKDELASIIGKPRIIPIFSEVHGPGNNAEYTIVKFVGVRILAVKLTGSMNSKYVMIQPAVVKTLGGKPSTTDTSDFVYSPPRLVH